MYRLENSLFQADIAPLGAELRSFFDKRSNREYIWQRAPNYWAKSSPVLFPVVGELKNGAYTYQGAYFNMPKHGFARDRTFHLLEQDDQHVSLILHADEVTKKCYPFDFSLVLRYELSGTTLSCTYEVFNRSDEQMFFSIGGHPALQLDFADGQGLSDYQLFFPNDKQLKRYFLNEGLLQEGEELVELQDAPLMLFPEMFDRDAWVIKNLSSPVVSLRNKRADYHLDIAFAGFPYFGLWAVAGSSFLCLEPWDGVNDNQDHNGDIAEKEGLIFLAPSTRWTKTWSIAVRK